MNINECGCRPYGWLGLDGDRCIGVIARQYISTETIRREAGGAITLYKSVGNITKARFHNNSASYSCGSIAVYNSSLSISDTTFENNISGVYGGAICNRNSSLNIECSTFQNNRVLNKVFGMGGGLDLSKNSTTTISNVFFSKCHANIGGAISSNSTTMIMSNSSVIANTRSAIHLMDGTSLEITNSTFFNNSTPHSGGAIACEDSAVNMVNTKFNQNQAVDSGGAFAIYGMSKLNAHNCSFTYNTAYIGSVMVVMYSHISFYNSNFAHNVASAGGTVYINNGYLSMTNCQ